MGLLFFKCLQCGKMILKSNTFCPSCGYNNDPYTKIDNFTNINSIDYNNSPENIYRIGEDYFYGENGKIQSDVKAVEQYEKATILGHIEATYSLGWMYYYGRGVQQDVKKAFEYFKNAAITGHIKAQRYTGECYWNGWGTPQNYTNAVQWYQKAAEQGDHESEFWVGTYYFNNNNKRTAFEWQLKAAQGGYSPAQLAVAGAYVLGQGIDASYSKSKDWYNRFLNTRKTNGTILPDLEQTLEKVLLDTYSSIEKYKEEQSKSIYLTPVTGDYLSLSYNGYCIHEGHHDICKSCSRRMWNGDEYEDGPHCRQY